MIETVSDGNCCFRMYCMLVGWPQEQWKIMRSILANYLETERNLFVSNFIVSGIELIYVFQFLGSFSARINHIRSSYFIQQGWGVQIHIGRLQCILK
jgi:hypothetical protein